MTNHRLILPGSHSRLFPLLAVLALGIAGMARAQDLSLGGIASERAQADRGKATAPPTLQQVLDKLKAGKELLDEGEFLVYLKGVEAKNPGKTWAHIASKLHDYFYGADRNIVICGIRLFLNGKENEGFEKVDLLGSPPKFIKNAAGQKVDISHSYAGAAALVERGTVNAWLMGKINTGWGDSVQVAGGWIKGTGQIAKGIFTWNGAKIDEGASTFSGAGNFKPPDQVRGNEIGMKVMGILKEERTLELSEAYRRALGR